MQYRLYCIQSQNFLMPFTIAHAQRTRVEGKKKEGATEKSQQLLPLQNP